MTKHSIVPIRPDQHHRVTDGDSLKITIKRDLALRLMPEASRAQYDLGGASEAFYGMLMPAVEAKDVSGKCMRRAVSGNSGLAVFQKDWGMLDSLTGDHWNAVHALFAKGEDGVPVFNTDATACV